LNDLVHLGAGPSFIPDEVKKQVIKEVGEYEDSRLSVLEVSHRSKQFEKTIYNSEKGLRDLLKIPKDFFVVFIQGGATLQNTLIPLNFSNSRDKLGHIVTGAWSSKTYNDSSKLRDSNIIFDGKQNNYTSTPLASEISTSNNDLVFFTSNETIHGVQIRDYTGYGDNLIIDMSSDIASRTINWKNIVCLYAGAQKNLGTAGVTLLVGRSSELVDNNLTSYLDLSNHIEKSSLYNTPPILSIVVLEKMIQWLINKGGLEYFSQQSERKAIMIYDLIDSHGDKLSIPVNHNARSYSNAVFDFKEKNHLDLFLKEAEEAGFHGIRGHRDVGGVRVSLYNSIEIKAVEKFSSFFDNFMKKKL